MDALEIIQSLCARIEQHAHRERKWMDAYEIQVRMRRALEERLIELGESQAEINDLQKDVRIAWENARLA